MCGAICSRVRLLAGIQFQAQRKLRESAKRDHKWRGTQRHAESRALRGLFAESGRIWPVSHRSKQGGFFANDAASTRRFDETLRTIE